MGPREGADRSEREPLLGCFGPGTVLGYCTNVHAGRDWAEARENLLRYASAVRRRVAPNGVLPVGLWFSAEASEDLLGGGRTAELRELLVANGLKAFTLNGFPFGNFHQPVVKHAVYSPDWLSPERMAYTLNLAEILAGLLEPGEEGTISSLPVSWGAPAIAPTRMREELRRVFGALDDGLRIIEDRSGRTIRVALEPEPGCFLSELRDVEDVTDWIFDGRWPERIGLCWDVCHGGVMFEDPAASARRLLEIGVRIHKVQISSAVAARLSGVEAGERLAVRESLGRFDEKRYLHQTSVRRPDGSVRLDEDLGTVVGDDSVWRLGPNGAEEVRVHFHVPVFAEHLGNLGTTQSEIGPAIIAARQYHGVRHFEVETYAWGVLPEGLRPTDLSEGIARELEWTIGLAGRLRLEDSSGDGA